MAKNGEKKEKINSLSKRVRTLTIIGAVSIGVMGLLVGIAVYVQNLVDQKVSNAFSMAASALHMAKKDVDLEGMAERTMEIYKSLTEEELEKMGTEEYYAHFSEITESEDYSKLYEIIQSIHMFYLYEGVYFTAYDLETETLVYVVSHEFSDQDDTRTGMAVHIPANRMESFLSGEEIPIYASNDVHLFSITSGLKITNERKPVTGIIMGDFTMGDVGEDIYNFSIHYLSAIVITAIIFAIILNKRMKRTLVDPINEIAQAAEEYVSDRQQGINDKEHFSLLEINTGDEVEHLSHVMAQMEYDLSNYMDNMKTMTAKEERARAELDMAANIQKDALPDSFPAFPERKEFDLYAVMKPAKLVGGDFYDFFLVDDDHLCVIIADVSDKGVPAALLMMAAKTVLQNNAMLGLSPGKIMEDTNNVLCANNKQMMFVTVWLGVLELSSGKLVTANAGHEYPALRLNGDDYNFIFRDHNPMVGGFEGLEYQEYEVKLSPGDKLFIYTDGVTEAHDSEENMFGEKRLLEALNKHKDADPYETICNVEKAIADFVKDAEQFDDTTMLSLSYLGPDGSNKASES